MTDDNEIDLDLDQPLDAEKIQAEARESFSLTDRLKGIKHASTRVPIFTDLDAVAAYQKANDDAQTLADSLAKIDQAKNPDMHASFLERFNEVDESLEPLRAKMLEGALSIHLRGYPNVAVKVARRDARKKFTDPDTKMLKPNSEQEIAEFIDSQLLGASIVKVVDHSGHELDLGPRADLANTLSEMLPPSQWQRLYDAFAKTTLADQIGQGATDDPGF